MKIEDASILNERTVKRNVRLIWVLRVSRMLGAVVAPGFVALLQNMGLTLGMVFLTQAVFALAIASFEVPTGYFADRLGRKHSILVGLICQAIASCVYCTEASLSACIWAEILFALGFAFISGADAALLYDTLKAGGQKERYTRVFGSIEHWGFWAGAVASIGGGWAASIDIRMPFQLELARIVVSLMATLMLYEVATSNTERESKIEKTSMMAVIRECLFTRRNLRWLMLSTAILGGCNSAAVWLYQPYLLSWGIGLYGTGLAFAAMNIVASQSSRRASKVAGQLGTLGSLQVLLAMVVVGHLGLAFGWGVWAIAFIAFQQWARGFSGVIVSGYINSKVRSNIRATAISLNSMLSAIVFASANLIVGLVVDYSNGVRCGFAVAGFATLFIGGGYMLMRSKAMASRAFARRYSQRLASAED